MDITTRYKESGRTIMTQYIATNWKTRKIDKFLDNLPKLNHEELESLNRPVMFNKTESVVETISTKKSPVLDKFTTKLYQFLKKN
jgi:hypothetical protein